jgi:hypothetical protein
MWQKEGESERGRMRDSLPYTGYSVTWTAGVFGKVIIIWKSQII